MTTRWLLLAGVVLGCAVLSTEASATNGLSGVRCVSPSPLEDGTAKRNGTVHAMVTFSNGDLDNDLLITRGALGQHLGNVNVVGPIAFGVNVVVPRATPLPPNPDCIGCPFPKQDGQMSLTVPIRIPQAARAGTFISVGLSFFGRKSNEPTQMRHELGSDGCVLEIVP